MRKLGFKGRKQKKEDGDDEKKDEEDVKAGRIKIKKRQRG